MAYQDRSLPFYYNYLRDYYPGRGRYVGSDPVGLKGGLSIYAYSRNAPLQNIDPLGLFNYYPPDPGRNTTICDGDGNLLPQLRPTHPWNATCLGDCILAHEIMHVLDLMRYGSSACKGKPKGTIVTFGTTNQVNSSERRSYYEELACLRDKLNRGDRCNECSPTVQNRIDQLEAERRHYE